jgi:O-antigen/teichoic acid export membrane protein
VRARAGIRLENGYDCRAILTRRMQHFSAGDNSFPEQSLRDWISHSRGWVASPTVRTLLANAVILGLGLVSSIQLSRWLGPEGRGEIAAAVLWPMLITYFVSGGIITSLLYHAAQPEIRTPDLVANAIILALVQGAVGMTVGYAIMPWVLHSQPSAVIQSSRWYLLVIPISLLSQYGCSLLQARLHFSVLNSVRMVIPAGYVIGLLALKWSSVLTFQRVVNLQLILNVAVLVAVVAGLWRLQIPVGFRPEWDLAARTVRYGLRVFSGDLSNGMNLRLDQILMSAFLGPAVLGLYVVAVSASGLVDIVSVAWRMVATPSIAGKGSAEERRALLTKTFRRYFLVSIPLATLLALLLPILIPLFFGRAFRAAIWPSEVLLVGAACLSAKNVLGGGLQALGSPWLSSRADLVALAVTLLTLPPLLWRFGILGAAMASTLAYATQLYFALHGLQKVHSISARSLVTGSSNGRIPIAAGITNGH